MKQRENKQRRSSYVSQILGNQENNFQKSRRKKTVLQDMEYGRMDVSAILIYTLPKLRFFNNKIFNHLNFKMRFEIYL